MHFLALLELYKRGMVDLAQAGNLADLHVTWLEAGERESEEVELRERVYDEVEYDETDDDVRYGGGEATGTGAADLRVGSVVAGREVPAGLAAVIAGADEYEG